MTNHADTSAAYSHGMRKLNQRPIVVYPVNIELARCLEGGVLLSQLLWLASYFGRPFFKTDKELQAECHLSDREFKRAKSVIKSLKFIKLSRRGVPAKTWYEISLIGYLDAVSYKTADMEVMPESVQSSSDDGVPTGSDNGVLTGLDDGVRTNTYLTTERTQRYKSAPNGDMSDDKPKRNRFIKPSMQEVQAYCRERKNRVDPESFIDHYEANGWHVGKNPMKDWRAAIRTWERSSPARASPRKAQSAVERVERANGLYSYGETFNGY